MNAIALSLFFTSYFRRTSWNQILILSITYDIYVFSSTFANSKRRVFASILSMLKPIVASLVHDILADMKNKRGCEAANQWVRKKGSEAREMEGRLVNQTTVLLLAGTTDVYQ